MVLILNQSSGDRRVRPRSDQIWRCGRDTSHPFNFVAVQTAGVSNSIVLPGDCTSTRLVAGWRTLDLEEFFLRGPEPETGCYPGRVHKPNDDCLPVVSFHTAAPFSTNRCDAWFCLNTALTLQMIKLAIYSCHFSRQDQQPLPRNEESAFIYLCMKSQIHSFNNY